MIRLITVITMILMPIISVSTGSTGSETILQSRDLYDQNGCHGTSCGGPGAFQGGGSAFVDGSRD